MSALELQALRVALETQGMKPAEIEVHLARLQLMDNQCERRSIYRDEGGVEVELEVWLDVDMVSADPSVGIMTGGAVVYPTATRVDTGAGIELTPMELQRFEEAFSEESSEYDGPDTWEEARGER